MRVDVRVGKPRVAYKEAITRSARAEGKFVRQTGGHGQYGHVVIEVEPCLSAEGSLEDRMQFETDLVAGSVPKEYFGSVERGAREGLGCGTLAGYPVVGLKVTLVDGSFHSADSSDLAFEQAAAIAIEKAIKEAGPILLEPVMRVQVATPEASFGAVQANLLGRRGVITNCHLHGGMRVIDADVPLVEMFGYSSHIRSQTAGRGTFTMEPSTYEKVPEQVAQAIIL